MAKGSIYPYALADGSTSYLVMYRTSNGAQRKKRGFTGRREAERWLNKTMAAVDAGQVVATKETFGSYIDRWLAEHGPRLEEGTERDYRINIEKRLKPFFGHMALTDIAPADVRRYVSELVDGTAAGSTLPTGRIEDARVAAERLGELTVPELARALGVQTDAARRLVSRLEAEGTLEQAGWRVGARRGRPARVYRFSGAPAEATARDSTRRISAKTINNSLVVLRVALGHAHEDGLIARNPAASSPGARERIKLPREHREMDFLRLDEIPRYLDACSPVYRPLAEVLIGCGLRISEALALRWPDVDFERSTLLVWSSLKRGRSGGETTGSTKGDRSRAVEFGPRLERILRDLRARQAELGTTHLLAEPIFVGRNGQQLNRHDVSSYHHKVALRRAGLRRSLRLHDLRHTAAASWLAAGLPLIYVQRQLGHSSIVTTESQYGHLEKSFLRGAARRAEAVIWEGRLEAPARA